MSVGVIELNDAGLRYGLGDNIIIESPGVSLVKDKEILLGTPAMAQARLHPVQTNNIFWHRLSAEPLTNHSNFCRHHADLAYSQLLDIHKTNPQCDKIIFAIPGSFSHEQMSLLLGIVGECPFTAVGIVDSAIAASSLYASAESSLHLDIQLHQCIFTQLTINHESNTPHLQRGQVEVLPNVGLISIMDQWAKKLADHFVDQTRFDPFYSAATEQSLYDQIPHWLHLSQQSNELVLEVNNKTIKLSREQFISPLLPIYKNIAAKAEQLIQQSTTTGQAHLLISDRLSSLPGLLESLDISPNFKTLALPDNAIMRGVQVHEKLISDNSEHLQLILDLPAQSFTKPETNNVEPSTTSSSAFEKHATHLLLNHIAQPIGANSLYINEENDNNNLHSSTDKDTNSLFSLRRSSQVISLIPFCHDRIKINGKVISDNCILKLGDEISVSNHGDLITLISVLDSDGT